MKKKKKLNKPVNLSQNNRKQKETMSLTEVANYIQSHVSRGVNPTDPPSGSGHKPYCYNHYYDVWSGCDGWTCIVNGIAYATWLCDGELTYKEL